MESDSSSGDSPVTVIPRHGSVGGSTGVSPFLESASHSESPPQIVDRSEGGIELSSRIRPVGVKDSFANTDPKRYRDYQQSSQSPRMTHSVGTNTDASGFSVDTYKDTLCKALSKTVDSFSQTFSSSHEDKWTEDSYPSRSFGSQVDELSITDLETSTSTGPPSVSLHSEANKGAFVSVSVTNQPDGRKSLQAAGQEMKNNASHKGLSHEFSQADEEDPRSSVFFKDSERTAVSLWDSSAGKSSNDDSSSTTSRGSTLSPLTIHAILDDDADSAFSMSTLKMRQMVSVGTGVNIHSLDDSTQTEYVEPADSSMESVRDNSRQSNQLGMSYSSEGDSHDMSTIQRELDKLHNERIEIIELLSLHYLPSSLTIELLEAKLNYCIGQTDTLLANLEDAWGNEDTQPTRSQTLIKVTREYLEEYKTQLNESRKHFESCLETQERKQRGIRGRRKTRGRDVLEMRRRAEIEAFQLERLREQCRYEREKARKCYNPFKTSSSSFESSSTTGPRLMTPRQRRDHLVSLRRQIVDSSAWDRTELRPHSTSPHSSPHSSQRPTHLQWAYRASSCSPTRSETSSVFRLSGSPPESVYSAWASPYSLSTLPSPIHHQLPKSHRADPALRDMTPDFRTNVVASYSSRDLHPDRLIEESNEVRRQNQIQIEQAHEVLRLLDERRHQMNQSERRQTSNAPYRNHAYSYSPSYKISTAKNGSISTSSPLQKGFTNGMGPEPSFAAYARDHLVRGQRKLTSFVPDILSSSPERAPSTKPSPNMSPQRRPETRFKRPGTMTIPLSSPPQPAYPWPNFRFLAGPATLDARESTAQQSLRAKNGKENLKTFEVYTKNQIEYWSETKTDNSGTTTNWSSARSSASESTTNPVVSAAAPDNTSETPRDSKPPESSNESLQQNTPTSDTNSDRTPVEK
ncbi:unnamed protein product [Lymnaea stagnalis]|uniref:Uncharacterized protein n=1 Tax=Lymnaea stagnalis TaxID=6523 RepID=A0AAV2HUE1_LYMST